MEFVEEIERACFPAHMRHDRSSFRAFISSDYSAGLLMFLDGLSIGYISGTHLSDEYLTDVLSVDSPVRDAQDETFYIDNIAIIDAHRSVIALDFLIHEMVGLLKEEDYRYAIAYIRRSHGLSRLMRIRYGATCLKTVDNWEGLEESFDCMLFTLAGIPTLPLAAEHVYEMLRKMHGKIHARRRRRALKPDLPEGRDSA